MQTYLRTPTGEVFTSSNPEYHSECERLTQSAGKLARRAYVADELRKILAPGKTVYTILRHVSTSGMSSHISLTTIYEGEPRHLDNLVADLLDYRQHKHGGLIVTGYGMDMGFGLVYNLGAALWPDGTSTPHGTRNGEPDSTGGYALKHSWL